MPSAFDNAAAAPKPGDAFIDELRWRGLLNQVTDEQRLREHLRAAPRRVYIGFDPTAPSLTIGNLVQIMILAHAQRCGHTPVVLAGGGTGLIGDPSGKTTERQLRSREEVRANVDAQSAIFDAVLDFTGERFSENPAVRMNNLEWLDGLSYIDALRDIGKHFSVNQMMQKEAVRERLNNREQGISYTEFSYMIIQSLDFLHMFREEGVTVQAGGSDQWGNITAGVDLIRRVAAQYALDAGATDAPEVDAFGLTTPLITKADGGKFGKTESGAVWLTADRTTPHAYFQFWLNTQDADAERFLRIFTFLDEAEIAVVMAKHAKDPAARHAQRTLAQEATAVLHGPEESRRAERAGQALFSGDLASLDEASLEAVLAEAPGANRDRAELAGEGAPLVDVLIEVGLAASKREARQFLSQGSVSVNGEKVEHNAEAAKISEAHLLHGRLIALRRGKKRWLVLRYNA